MRRSTLIHFKVINGLSREDFLWLSKTISAWTFDDEEGCGFISTVLDGNILDTRLVLKMLTYRTIFNPLTGEFEREQSFYFTDVPFSIDLGYNTLEVYSGADNAKRAISIVGRLLEFKYAIADVVFQLEDVLNRLSRAGHLFSIQKLVVNNFRPNSGLIGTFSPRVLETAYGLDLISQYKNDVSQATIELEVAEEKGVEVRIAQSGNLTVRCDPENLDMVLDELKRVLFGGD